LFAERDFAEKPSDCIEEMDRYYLVLVWYKHLKRKEFEACTTLPKSKAVEDFEACTTRRKSESEQIESLSAGKHWH